MQEFIKELNATAGKLLPGVRIEPYYAGSDGETGALWVYGMFPLNAFPEQIAEGTRSVAKKLREFPEVERVVSQMGTSAEDDLPSYNHVQLFVGLKAASDMPAAPGRDRPRSRTELLEAFNRLLRGKALGADWMTTTKGPGELGLVFPGVPAENLLKIVGPDLNELERLAGLVQEILGNVPGIENIAVCHSLGQPHLAFRRQP